MPYSVRPPEGQPHPCPICEVEFLPKRSGKGWTRVCSCACNQRLRSPIPRAMSDHRSARHRRDAATPGLRPAERSRLLRKWKAQGRSCAYCTAPPTSVDHVVPLSRGGTNWEGNLAPACRSCNSSKGTYLLTEWKHAERRRDDPIVRSVRPELRRIAA
ncbi:MAG: hypothetical protein NVSMB4_04140 [Acidimicrobiales bacterium]